VYAPIGQVCADSFPSSPASQTPAHRQAVVAGPERQPPVAGDSASSSPAAGRLPPSLRQQGPAAAIAPGAATQEYGGSAFGAMAAIAGGLAVLVLLGAGAFCYWGQRRGLAADDRPPAGGTVLGTPVYLATAATILGPTAHVQGARATAGDVQVGSHASRARHVLVPMHHCA
jgi:hypothetical protein